MKLVITGTRIKIQQQKTREIFRNEVVLAGGKTYNAGASDEVKFSITGVPADSPVSVAVAVMQVGLGMLSGSSNRSEVEWTLEARLDCPGLDFVTKELLFFE